MRNKTEHNNACNFTSTHIHTHTYICIYKLSSVSVDAYAYSLGLFTIKSQKRYTVVYWNQYKDDYNIYEFREQQNFCFTKATAESYR